MRRSYPRQLVIAGRRSPPRCECLMSDLTHIDKDGNAVMVDVTAKDETVRVAKAVCSVLMSPDTVAAISDARIKKGDVLSIAQIAGIMGAKKTADLIPLCHPLPLTSSQ